MLSAGHLFLIFLIVVLFFGAKRLPELAKSLGHAMNEFKKAKDEVADDGKSPEKKAEAVASMSEKTDMTQQAGKNSAT